MNRGSRSSARLQVARSNKWLATAALLAFAGCCCSEPEFTPPPSPSEEASVPIPVAAVDLPAGHRIVPDDIIELEYSLSAMLESGWQTSLVMVRRKDIEGRVLRRPTKQNMPFLVTDLYLEGTEPGAPPEPDVEETPWPPRADVVLLVDDLSAPRTEDQRRLATFLLPVAANDLPKNRRLRSSDIGFVSLTVEEANERPMPEFEVLMRPEQFVDRRLRRHVAIHSPFLLSDFEIDGEIKAYLDEKLNRE